MPKLYPELIACPYCDELHHRVPLQPGEKMVCRCCGSTIATGNANFPRAFSMALTAVILFFIANSFPFITLTIEGDTTTISIFSSVKALFDNQLPILALIVMLCVILMPLWYLLSVLWVVISFELHIGRGLTRKFLHWLHLMAPWKMLEVYLVGVVVTLVKIMALADVHFDTGFWAFCALMICSILVDMRFNLTDAFIQANRDA